MKTLISISSSAACLVFAITAHANPPCDANQIWDAASNQCIAAPAATAPSMQPPVAPVAPVAPPPADPEATAEMQRAHWSGKRLLLEVLAGEATGVLSTLLLCDGSGCAGDGWVAWGVDVAVTPLAVWGVGTAMGGRGTLLSSYLGAGPALAPMSIQGNAGETPDQTLSRIQTEATVSAVVLPLCSALLYEVSSQIASVKWQREHAPSMTIQPVYTGAHVTGGVGNFSLAF